MVKLSDVQSDKALNKGRISVILLHLVFKYQAMLKFMITTATINWKKNYLLKVGLTTSAAILTVKWLSTLLVYHFFTFDKYLAVVAVMFLLAGHFLFPRKSVSIISPKEAASSKIILPKPNEYAENLKAIRYSLTNRELVIFRHLTEGKTNKEISEILGIQVSTIKTHVNNLFTKLKCKNRKEAIEKWDQMIKNHFIL